jgi:radical SAM superfamily enzyme
MMLTTAKMVGQLDIQALKIHSLFILKDTALYDLYQKEPFPILTREEYIDLVVEQLRYIPSHVIIERLTGDADIHDLFEPKWSIKKVTILNDIDKKMKENDIYQGDKIKI